MDVFVGSDGAASARSVGGGVDSPAGEGEPSLGLQRIVGELKGLRVSVSATTVRSVLMRRGLRKRRTEWDAWRMILREQAATTLACDFLTVETAISAADLRPVLHALATRRIRCVACSQNPDGDWTARQARNLLMQLGDDQPSAAYP